MDFNLFLESGNRLHIERIHYPLTVIESGRTEPDWLEPKDVGLAAIEGNKENQEVVSAEGGADQ